MDKWSIGWVWWVIKGHGRVVGGSVDWIVDDISFQKIFGWCGLKGHVVAKRKDVMLVDGQRNVKIELEFRILNSQ